MSRNNTQEKKMPTILLAPLDWGMGHATRCIPIIDLLIQKGCKVIIAANGNHKKILQASYPDLQYVGIPNYDIQYGSTRWATIGKLLLQSLNVKKTIQKENKWLNEFVKKESIDIIISDNRYGLYHKSIKCIFITHQLKPILPILRVFEKSVQKKLYNYISQFSQCWVLDYEGEKSIAKALSNPPLLPSIPTRYVGIISRLQKRYQPTIYDAAIVLSGPEPQRTLLEKQIIETAPSNKQLVLIRGTSNPLKGATNSFLQIIDIASTKEINEFVNSAKFVISRSGYTSIMDWLCIEANPILIPTPGQTEQEYLAKVLSSQNSAICIEQKDLNVAKIIEEAASFRFRKIDGKENKLNDVINDLIA